MIVSIPTGINKLILGIAIICKSSTFVQLASFQKDKNKQATSLSTKRQHMLLEFFFKLAMLVYLHDEVNLFISL